MSSLRRILIGLVALSAMSAMAGWLYQRQVDRCRVQLPFLTPNWVYAGGEWYDD